jgi:hypothetical protein
MNKKKLQALAQRVAKGIKSEKDLCDYSARLKTIMVEAALNAEFGRLTTPFYMRKI